MLECFAFLPRLQYGANCYVLKSGGEYCVIDPTASYGEVSERLGDIADSVKYIILTHSHFDHTLTLEEWVEKTSHPPSASENAVKNLKNPDANCYRLFFGINKAYAGACNILREGDVLTLGADVIRVMETPGHTSGSICLASDGIILCGDTLFSGGSYGRYDLPTGDSAALSASIKRLLSLGDDTVLYCGHGEETTLKEAKKHRYI